jgi:hypothetical protein
MTTTLYDQADVSRIPTREEGDSSVLWHTRDGVVAKLRAFAEDEVKHSFLTKPLGAAGYRRGFMAGIDGEAESNPYRENGSNFLRGHNDPREAWFRGYLDGSRIRTLVSQPEKAYPGIRWREYKLLNSALKSRCDFGPTLEIKGAGDE